MRFWGWGVALLTVAGLASWGGGQLVAQGARAGLAQLAAEGGGEAQAVQAAGFPLAIGARVDGLTLTDTALGGQWEVARLRATAPLWAPLSWSARPTLPAQVTLAGRRFALAGEGAEGTLRLGLGSDLPVRDASFTLTAVSLTYEAATVPSLAVQSLSLAATGEGAQYAIEAKAEALALPPRLGASLAPGAKLPDVIETLGATGTLSFASPVTLTAATLPPFTEIDLTQAQIVWGGREISASGKVVISPRGLPEGTITLATKDWAAWLEVAQAAGLLERKQLPMLMGLGAFMAGQSGTGEVQLPLAFAKGMMSLGPLPLGPAPRFAQRQ